MIGYIIFCIGVTLLIFVALLKAHDKFLNKYIVRWVDINGGNCWTLVSACTEWGAIRIVQKTEEEGVKIITKVVRQR